VSFSRLHSSSFLPLALDRPQSATVLLFHLAALLLLNPQHSYSSTTNIITHSPTPTMRFTAAACLLPLLSSTFAIPFFAPRQIDSELVTVIANATGLANETDTVEMVATTWYAGWHGTDFPLVNMSWDKYTHVTYAFA